ncbi:hypothetical protein KP509_17G047900 [Ceratopteris richardii]|uniref:Tocopherol cyclase n=1 Tax=Ceratopteris richardii TaxID=49495 RepID=A0A8T2STX1_CERRI|nr:hypothetical protein KP509_17G047900 [Ceratopteris richardii]
MFVITENHLECVLLVNTELLVHGPYKTHHFSTTCMLAKRVQIIKYFHHHSYHFEGSKRRFFEGWYFRLTLPEEKTSFAFIYTIEDPAFTGCLSDFDRREYGPRFPGTGAQIMEGENNFLFQYSQETRNFWANRHELALGNTFVAHPGQIPPKDEVSSQEFQASVEQGYQVSSVWHQGFLCDDGRLSNTQTMKSVKWQYSTKPVFGWGDTISKQKATAGWLAALPVFEPHWQICMAGGLSTGWVEWGDKRHEFKDAPSYVEKNWGGSFPKKWFWAQCNSFDKSPGFISLTIGGGQRFLPLTRSYEEVALVGVHYNGKFYEFAPWKGPVEWEISPWGYWHVKAQNALYEVEVIGTTDDSGTPILCPTENGMAPRCRDTFYGDLKLELWERTSTGARGRPVLSVTSNMAALEVGGGPWDSTWRHRSESGRIAKMLLGLPIDVASLYKWFPSRMPPGL